MPYRVIDSEALPPAPPIRQPGDAEEVSAFLPNGPTIEGPLVPPVIPAPPPAPAGPLGLTGGPDGDQSVRSGPTQLGDPGFAFYREAFPPFFVFNMPSNPSEVPAPPPPAPPYGRVV
jgi:hypothetical protein